jgi:hypothetical protein
MDRSTLDKLISTTGLILVIVLLAASGGLFFAHSFINGQVREQLSAQMITFPAASSESLAALQPEDREAVSKYAGQQLKTGAQAETFANHYINAHLKTIGGGKTYSQLSEESRANPADPALKGKVDAMFRGETLRGLLLNAYAFDTMATVANIAAYGALAAGAVLLMFVALGFMHASAAKKAGSSKKRR